MIQDNFDMNVFTFDVPKVRNPKSFFVFNKIKNGT